MGDLLLYCHRSDSWTIRPMTSRPMTACPMTSRTMDNSPHGQNLLHGQLAPMDNSRHEQQNSKMSVGEMPWSKCKWGEIVMGQNICRAKCPKTKGLRDEMPVGLNVMRWMFVGRDVSRATRWGELSGLHCDDSLQNQYFNCHSVMTTCRYSFYDHLNILQCRQNSWLGIVQLYCICSTGQ